MKNFQIYEKENDIEAIAVGRFNFWAFFFTTGWALFTSHFRVFFTAIASYFFIVFLAIGILSGASADSLGAAIMVFLTIGFRLIFGIYANRWRVNRLERIGYSEKGEVLAKSAREARLEYAKKNNKNFSVHGSYELVNA